MLLLLLIGLEARLSDTLPNETSLLAAADRRCRHSRPRAADLTQTIDRRWSRSSPLAAHSNIGIHVVDLNTGKTLYARNEDRFFLPASNMKLFTTALALLKLGPDYRFETRLIEEPVGDLALVGSGDPSLSGRLYPYQRDRAAVRAASRHRRLGRAGRRRRPDSRAVATSLATIGCIPGLLIRRIGPRDDALGESGAPVSALTVNDNLITITFFPAAKPGDLAALSLSPPLEYFAIDNRILTVAGRARRNIRLTRAPGSRQILFEGSHSEPEPTTPTRTVAVDDPALYAACALYDALTRRGVVIDGHPVARHRAAGDAYAAAGRQDSRHALFASGARLIQMADKVSENLHAELLLREVGRVGTQIRQPGERCGRAERFPGSIGAPAANSRIDDGSGLVAQRSGDAAAGHAAAGLHVRLRACTTPGSRMLPVGGEDGTLSRRLCCVAGCALDSRQDRYAEPGHRALRLRRQQDPRLAGVFHPGERFRRARVRGSGLG